MFVACACPSCGLPIGDIAPIFRAILQNRMLKKYKALNYKVEPKYMMEASEDNKDLMADILVGLHLDKCCIIHVISNVEFKDHY
jgi:hypothetical protein